MFNGEIMFDSIRKRWKCLICNYGRGKYGRFQVFGNVASTHCYQSRQKMKDGIYKKRRSTQKENKIYPKNIHTHMAQEIKYKNITIGIIDENQVFICQKCDRFRSIDPVAIRGILRKNTRNAPLGEPSAHITQLPFGIWAT